MEIYNLILNRRSVRKFKQNKINIATLKKIVNAGRVAPSAANLQFIEYIIVNEEEVAAKIFPHTKWAVYIQPEGGPSAIESPSVYIAILINLKKSPNPDLRDIGAAAENIMLAAESFSLSSCWLGAIDEKELSRIFKLPGGIKLDSLIGLGYGSESPRMLNSDKDIKYWRDKRGQLFVPKRSFEKIAHFNRYLK
ncbi:MAG: nitroreductase family protein [Candidatus Kaelpia imicola]|nr:nitroreductase family protein [Candidatus Kaelpia imicola]